MIFYQDKQNLCTLKLAAKSVEYENFAILVGMQELEDCVCNAGTIFTSWDLKWIDRKSIDLNKETAAKLHEFSSIMEYI